MRKKLLLTIVSVMLVFCVNSRAWAMSGWADSVIAWNQGVGTFVPSNPNNALGVADFVDATIPKLNTFYNLGGIDGYLTVGFSNAVLLGSGIDLEVTEIGWQEPFKIRLPDNNIFTPIVLSSVKGLRAGYPDDRVTVFGFDFGDVGQWSQFTLFDGIPVGSGDSTSDIDAIKGITVTPEPIATLLFLVGGLPIGYSIYRKKRFKV